MLPAAYDEAMEAAPERITCVECGGIAHRMSYPPDEGFEPGDVVAYVCEDCGHRHDVELDPEAPE
jgi:hypothetical protein